MTLTTLETPSIETTPMIPMAPIFRGAPLTYLNTWWQSFSSIRSCNAWSSISTISTDVLLSSSGWRLRRAKPHWCRTTLRSRTWTHRSGRSLKIKSSGAKSSISLPHLLFLCDSEILIPMAVCQQRTSMRIGWAKGKPAAISQPSFA